MRALLSLLTLCMLQVGGCTLITKIEATECRSHRICDALNEGDSTSCVRWQCSGNIVIDDFDTDADELDLLLTAGVCILTERDLDNDGFPGSVCEASVQPGQIDCVDLSASAFPGASEDCDGLDNDCDGIVDEGVRPAPREVPIVVDSLPPFASVSAARSGGTLSLTFANRDEGIFRVRSADWQVTSLRPETHTVRSGVAGDDLNHFLSLGTELQEGCWEWRPLTEIQTVCDAGNPPGCEADPEIDCVCDPTGATIVDQCAQSGGACLPMQRASSCNASRAWSATMGEGDFIVFEGRTSGVLHAGQVRSGAIELPGPTRRSSVFGGLDLSFEEGFSPGLVGELTTVGSQSSGLVAWVRGSAAGNCTDEPVRVLSLSQSTYPTEGTWLSASNDGRAMEVSPGFSLASVEHEGTFIVAVGSSTNITIYRIPQSQNVTVNASERANWVDEPYTHAALPASPAIEQVGVVAIPNATELQLSSGDGQVFLAAREGCDATGPATVWASALRLDGGAASPARIRTDARIAGLDLQFDDSRDEWVVAWMENANTASAALLVRRLNESGTPISELRLPIENGALPFLYSQSDEVRAAVIVDRGAAARIEEFNITCAPAI